MEQLYLPGMAPPIVIEKRAASDPTHIKILAGLAALKKARSTREGARWLAEAISEASLSPQDRLRARGVLKERRTARPGTRARRRGQRK